MYVTAYDIVDRLLRKKPFWFHGKPQITYKIYNSRFNLLIFDFSDCKIAWKVYNKQKDVEDLAYLAVEHIANFTYKNLKEYQ